MTADETPAGAGWLARCRPGRRRRAGGRAHGWIVERYAPQGPSDPRERLLLETIVRYGRIAERESAIAGYLAGLKELWATLDEQPRRPLSPELFDRFTGLGHARKALGEAADVMEGATVAIVDEGKNAWVVRHALRELSVKPVDNEDDADVLVIGTLSPGPMMDAWERRREGDRPVIAPWRPRGMEPVSQGALRRSGPVASRSPADPFADTRTEATSASGP